VKNDLYDIAIIGGSLLPFSVQTFDRLGVREKLDRAFLPKFGGKIMAACGTRAIKFYFKDGFRSQRDRASLSLLPKSQDMTAPTPAGAAS
jgi:hypothetical protein